jgi:hypothetical protein
MTLWTQSLGNVDRTRTLLTTSNTEILSAANGTIAIAKIRLVNVTSSAVTVDLDVYDGTTHKPLLTGKSISANDAIEIYDESMAKGESLYAKAGANTSVWIHVLSSLPNKPGSSG